MAQAWKAVGTYFETCNCAVACPCVFLSAPTEGRCTALITWHIDRGNFGSIALDDLNIALLVHAPGHMLQTMWKAAVYLDERAGGQQQQALLTIFSGDAGGHPEHLKSLIGEVLGVRSVPIQYTANGRQRSVRIADIAQADIEALEGQGGALVTIANHPFAVAPGEPAVAATSKKLRVADHGIAIDISGKNGFYSPFSYQA